MAMMYGSFAGGFINAYLKARQLAMQRQYYQALMQYYYWLETGRRPIPPGAQQGERGFRDPFGLGKMFGLTRDEIPAAEHIAYARAGASAAGGYSVAQMVKMAQDQGWKGEDAARIASIAMAESRGDPNAVNPKSGAAGLIQVNPLAHGQALADEAKDPNKAFAIAKQIYDKEGWKAWASDPSSGKYYTPNNSMTTYLDEAKAALRAPPVETAKPAIAPAAPATTTAAPAKAAPARVEPVKTEERSIVQPGEEAKQPFTRRLIDKDGNSVLEQSPKEFGPDDKPPAGYQLEPPRGVQTKPTTPAVDPEQASWHPFQVAGPMMGPPSNQVAEIMSPEQTAYLRHQYNLQHPPQYGPTTGPAASYGEVDPTRSETYRPPPAAPPSAIPPGPTTGPASARPDPTGAGAFRAPTPPAPAAPVTPRVSPPPARVDSRARAEVTPTTPVRAAPAGATAQPVRAAVPSMPAPIYEARPYDLANAPGQRAVGSARSPLNYSPFWRQAQTDAHRPRPATPPAVVTPRVPPGIANAPLPPARPADLGRPAPVAPVAQPRRPVTPTPSSAYGGPSEISRPVVGGDPRLQPAPTTTTTDTTPTVAAETPPTRSSQADRPYLPPPPPPPSAGADDDAVKFPDVKPQAIPDQPIQSPMPVMANIDPKMGQVEIPVAGPQPVSMDMPWQPTRPMYPDMDSGQDQYYQESRKGGPIWKAQTGGAAPASSFPNVAQYAGMGTDPTGPSAGSAFGPGGVDYLMSLNPSQSLATVTSGQLGQDVSNLTSDQQTYYNQQNQLRQAAQALDTPTYSTWGGGGRSGASYQTTINPSPGNQMLANEYLYAANSMALPSTAQPAAQTPAATPTPAPTPASSTTQVSLPAPAQTAVNVPGSDSTTASQPSLFSLPNTSNTGTTQVNQSPNIANMGTSGTSNTSVGSNATTYGLFGSGASGTTYNVNAANQAASAQAQTGFRAGGTVFRRFQDGGDLGDQSASIAGAPPGIPGSSPQIPPIYYNPATYAPAGAPIGKGVTATSYPTFTGMAAPTFQAKGGLVRRFQGGGMSDFDPNMGSQDMAQAGYEANYADLPSQDAQDVSFSPGSTVGVAPMSPLRMGGSGGMRMSMRRPSTRGAGAAGQQEPELFYPGIIGTGEGSTDLPPWQQQIPGVNDNSWPVANSQGDMDGSLVGMIAHGIQTLGEHLGLGQHGAIAASPDVQGARDQHVKGGDRIDDENWAAMEKSLGPEGEKMREEFKNLAIMKGMYTDAYENGHIAEAGQIAAGIIMKAADVSSYFGKDAIDAYYNGDVQGFLTALKRGANQVPDGIAHDAQDNGDGTAHIRTTNLGGNKVVYDGDVPMQTLLRYAYGMADKSLAYRQLETLAQPYLNPTSPEDRAIAASERSEQRAEAKEQRAKAEQEESAGRINEALKSMDQPGAIPKDAGAPPPALQPVTSPVSTTTSPPSPVMTTTSDGTTGAPPSPAQSSQPVVAAGQHGGTDLGRPSAGSEGSAQPATPPPTAIPAAMETSVKPPVDMGSLPSHDQLYATFYNPKTRQPVPEANIGPEVPFPTFPAGTKQSEMTPVLTEHYRRVGEREKRLADWEQKYRDAEAGRQRSESELLGVLKSGESTRAAAERQAAGLEHSTEMQVSGQKFIEQESEKRQQEAANIAAERTSQAPLSPEEMEKILGSGSVHSYVASAIDGNVDPNATNPTDATRIITNNGFANDQGGISDAGRVLLQATNSAMANSKGVHPSVVAEAMVGWAKGSYKVELYDKNGQPQFNRWNAQRVQITRQGGSKVDLWMTPEDVANMTPIGVEARKKQAEADEATRKANQPGARAIPPDAFGPGSMGLQVLP